VGAVSCVSVAGGVRAELRRDRRIAARGDHISMSHADLRYGAQLILVGRAGFPMAKKEKRAFFETLLSIFLPVGLADLLSER